MKKLLIILTIIFVNNLFAQNNIDDILYTILKNNHELQAIRQLNKFEILQAKDELIPENPEFEQEFQENNNYEIGITQRFQFPNYYYHQYKNLQLTKEQQQSIYMAAKQKVLEKAKITIFTLQYLEKQIKIQESRLKNAKLLDAYFTKMLDEGEITQLQSNQVKIHKTSFENQLNEFLSEKIEMVETLKTLNGGLDIDLNISEFSSDIPVVNIKKIEQDYLAKNPTLKIEQINQQIANRNFQIAKYSWLPDFNIGVHTDKESNTNLHYGISIPLWKNRNKINRAKAGQRYQEANLKHTEASLTSEFRSLTTQYSLLSSSYKTYTMIKQALNSKELLEKSLREQEISSIEYFTELENLYNFEDNFLKARLDLEIVITRLTSFQLVE